MTKITVDNIKCSGCGECADECPEGVLECNGFSVIVYNMNDCSFCENCMDVCPTGSIVVEDDGISTWWCNSK